LFLEVLLAAIVGAVISVIGFGLFAVAHYLVRRRLEAVAVYVYESWLACVAPVIGAVVGGMVAGGIVGRGVYVVVISALVGGMAMPILELLTIKKGKRSRGIIGPAVAGIGYGVINGIILAIALVILQQIGWVSKVD
jgi:hypothetical protein